MIQDLFYDGDQFAVYDNGNLILTSSTPANDGALCGPSPFDDPLGCSGNAKFSSGSVGLGAGSHSITIFLLQETTGINSGRAVFEIAGEVPGAVPEPTTMSLMGLGLGGILLGWRKRRAQ